MVMGRCILRAPVSVGKCGVWRWDNPNKLDCFCIGFVSKVETVVTCSNEIFEHISCGIVVS
jgi:hypothetical protein